MRSFTRITAAAVLGASAERVDVQVSIAGEAEGGEARFNIVGLPDSAMREGRERIRSAVVHGGWPWPHRHVTVNLAPAGARKQGAALDLPIALAVMAAHGSLGSQLDLSDWLCLGELTLDGAVRPVRGMIAAAEAGMRAGLRNALVPPENAEEAAAVRGLRVHPVGTLTEAVGHLTGAAPVDPRPSAPWRPAAWGGRAACPVRGQPIAVRAAWIAAVGGHNLLLSGPPGSGKTLLARYLATLLPPLGYDEAVEASRVHSVAGVLNGGLLRTRPFRAPHHSASTAGLVGGGTVPGPGEVSLAHLGVLFLDELAEFSRTALESLRQPIEDGHLELARAAGRARLPTEVLLVGATNPCPCGWYGSKQRCRCTRATRERYQVRISGPLRDRFDMRVEVQAVDAKDLIGAPEPAPYTEEAVRTARRRQQERMRALDARPWNARLPGRCLPAAARLEAAASEQLLRSARALQLSGRGVHRTLRVARTIADLRDADLVSAADVAAAVSLRT